MIIWGSFFCLSTIAAILGESTLAKGDNRAVYESESPGRRIDPNSNPQDQISRFLDSGSEEDAEEEVKRETPRRGIVDPEVTDQLEGNGWLDVIPGTPGKDYPNYERIPETSFTCDDKTPGGYYADIEARCQVFHVCNTGGQKSSFVCPSGSIFNQKYFVCDWWYDFECDDATDLYSLNEKVNRGGTGSGPGGPGRIEQGSEYYSDDQNFPREELQNQGNFVSADGFDLSLAGTGEGGPGYARNGDNKGYQSNVDDEEDRETQNGQNQGQGTRRKSFNSRKVAGESSKPDYSAPGNKKQEKNQAPIYIERSNSRDESGKGVSPHFVKSREEESADLSDPQGGREHFRKQNSPAGNPRVNYQAGYEGPSSNGPLKTSNFRSGNGRNDRAEQSNRLNENRHNPSAYSSPNTQNQEANNYDNYPQKSTQNHENTGKNHNRKEDGNGFGQRSSTSQSRSEYLAAENADNNYGQGSPSPGPSSGFNNEEFPNSEGVKEEQRNSGDEGANKNREFNTVRSPGPSSGSDNNEYRSSFGTRPANIRGRQRTGGGLPGGLGNGYPSPGRARELPGSDAIAGGITRAGETLYDEEDQRSLNSQHRTSSGTRNSDELAVDSQKIGFDHRNQNSQRSDSRDENQSPGSDTFNGQWSKNRKYSPQNSPSRNEKPFESSGQVTDQDHQSSVKNYGSDYLLGIVPGTEDRGNGTSSSNQPRRYLPIL